MSEFDNLVGDAEQEAKDHPQQVHEAEQDAEHAVENKFGDGTGQNQGQGSQDQGGQQNQGQGDRGQGDQQSQGGDSGQGQGQSDHDQ
jgi:hypothetical protein